MQMLSADRRIYGKMRAGKNYPEGARGRYAIRISNTSRCTQELITLLNLFIAKAFRSVKQIICSTSDGGRKEGGILLVVTKARSRGFPRPTTLNDATNRRLSAPGSDLMWSDFTTAWQPCLQLLFSS